jgi:hypothetical protein
LDTCVQALFADCEALKGGEVVFLCGAAGRELVSLKFMEAGGELLDGCVAEDHCSRSVVVDCCADALAFGVDGAVFEFPRLSVWVVLEAWVVIAFVEVF